MDRRRAAPGTGPTARILRAGVLLPAGLLLVLVGLVACTKGPPEAVPPSAVPVPADGPLVSRHWDQVCMDDHRATIPFRVSEIVDIPGLREAWRGTGPGPRDGGPESESPAGPAPAARATDPDTHPVVGPDSLDLMVLLDREGRPVDGVSWSSSLAEEDRAELESLVLQHTGGDHGLLEPTAVRLRVRTGDEHSVSLPPPSVCLPHMVHPEGGGPPVGLPDTVRTAYLRAHGIRNLPRVAVVLQVDETGALVGTEISDGAPGATPEVVAAVRDLLPRLRFDPALRNGMPVAGRLQQVFWISRRR